MSFITDIIEADFARILSEFGVEATIAEQPFTVLVGDPAPALTLEEGGYDSDDRLTIKALKSAFGGTLPAEGTLVTMGGTNYRVRTASDKPGHPITLIDIRKA